MEQTPPPPKRRPLGMVLGLVAVVAAIVGAAAYAILTAPGPPEEPPSVSIVLFALGDPGDARVRVTEAEPELPLTSFRVAVVDLYSGADVLEAVLRPGTVYSDGATAFLCDDLTVPGRLSVGDEFRLVDFPTGTSYGLTLVHVATQRSLASVTIPL